MIEKKLMCSAAVAALLLGYLHASGAGIANPVNDSRSSVLTIEASNTFESSFKIEKATRSQQRVMSSGDASVTLSVSAIVPDVEVYTGQVFVVSENLPEPVVGVFDDDYVAYMEFEYNCTVDVISYFITVEGTYILVNEDVALNGDVDLTVDFSDATNFIEFNSTMPDGKKPCLLGHGETETEDSGDIIRFDMFNDIKHIPTATGLITSFIVFEAGYYDGQYFDGSDVANVYINPNNCIMILQAREYTSIQGDVSALLVADGCNSQKVEADASDFVEYNFDCTIPGKELNLPEGYELISPLTFNNNLVMKGDNWDNRTDCVELGADYPDFYKKSYVANLAEDKGFRILPMPAAGPVLIWNGEIGCREYFGINMPPCIKQDGTIYYLGTQLKGVGYSSLSDALFTREFGKPVSRKILNNYCTYAVGDNESVPFGSMAPATVFLKAGGKLVYTYPCPLGELRSIDIVNSKVSATCDGETICSNPFEMITHWSFLTGAWDITIDNSNFSVNDLPGRNYCEMHLKASESFNPFPTLTQYAFRTTDNKIVNSFDKTSDGILQFYAGGFQYVEDWSLPMDYERMGYEYSELKEVKVEYSHYGADDWKELTVEEVPEKFHMPGYGAYYEGPLSSIDSSDRGAYDIRITLTDQYDDTQMQTISPAFFIGNGSGVDVVLNDSDNIRVDGRDIIAPSGAEVYKINGVLTGNCNLEPGVYIVRNGSKTHKVVVM